MVLAMALAACGGQSPEVPRINWYVFDEQSGSFTEAAARCSDAAAGAYRIELIPLPVDAGQQREQLVRRLAAGDPDIDLIGMDVIWTPEFAEAGWILPWPQDQAKRVSSGRLAAATESATYEDRLWAAPFVTNTQLLWYRRDRVEHAPRTWDEMIAMAEALGEVGRIQAQGQRYEGFTVFFVSLLASAGGSVLGADSTTVALGAEPTLDALRLMRRFANSPASSPALSTAREDQARRAFESGDSSFMLNYTYVWPSAQANAPQVAENMAWARWPAVVPGLPSRVTVGGINIGVGAHSPHAELAMEAAACIASPENQLIAARRGGLPPTVEALYDDPEVRRVFPFADVLRATLRDATQRPQTPLYNDVSLAIIRTLHPMSEIQPQRDLGRLREAVARALRSEGLL